MDTPQVQARGVGGEGRGREKRATPDGSGWRRGGAEDDEGAAQVFHGVSAERFSGDRRRPDRTPEQGASEGVQPSFAPQHHGVYVRAPGESRSSIDPIAGVSGRPVLPRFRAGDKSGVPVLWPGFLELERVQGLSLLKASRGRQLLPLEEHEASRGMEAIQGPSSRYDS